MVNECFWFLALEQAHEYGFRGAKERERASLTNLWSAGSSEGVGRMAGFLAGMAVMSVPRRDGLDAATSCAQRCFVRS